MADSTIVFITGVSRGLGKALLEIYLLRPNHIVIGSVRDSAAPSAQGLKNLPTGKGSRLILVSIEATSAEDVPKAIKTIEAAGIDHLDIVIANSGICPEFATLDKVAAKDVTDAFAVNVMGPIFLWQGVKPLLEKSRKSPKWVSMSSATGCITLLESNKEHRIDQLSAYGMSKAAYNWFTVAVHTAHPWLIAFAVHPGWLQTDMGNDGARGYGLEQAPHDLKEISKTVDLIDNATREKRSGKFLYPLDDKEMPW